MSKKKEIKMEGGMDTAKVVEYLTRLASSIESGTVQLEKGNEIIVLHPTDSLKFEVEAVQKKDKEKIAIEVSWKRSDASSPKSDDFAISPRDPKRHTPGLEE